MSEGTRGRLRLIIATAGRIDGEDDPSRGMTGRGSERDVEEDSVL